MTNSIANALIALAIAGAALPASAQTILPSQVPLNDANCLFPAFPSDPPQAVPPTNIPTGCPVDGARTVTKINETVTPVLGPQGRPTGLSFVTGNYSVDFAGNLHPDGVPVLATGSGPLVLDASTFFGDATTVNLVTSYDATLNNAIVLTSDVAAGNYSYFQGYGNFQTTVNGININLSGAPTTVDGREYLFDLSTPNPTAIIGGNSVAITGRYNSSDSHGALVFGRITGTATLIENAGVTPSPDTSRAGSSNGGYWSPFALSYQTTSVETTRLDENGLTTPTISVNQGINMNGSRVTNLAPGVAPGDAVNVAQLASEAGQRMAADAMLTDRISLVEGSLARLDSRLEVLDNRINSSAAVATALGGTTFLPDMTFNLSANVATYGGAHAGAVQMGARVNRNVAVNAGIASGFNKGGKTAARVGVTFGW